MSIKSYENAIKSERTALRYVLVKCFKTHQRFCPYCGSRKFWKLADKRRRCQRCKKIYHDFTKRWWNQVHLPMDDWLRIVKLFDMELSTRKISKETGLPYKTVFKAVMTIRYAILTHASDAREILMSGEIELDESYFGGKRKGNRGRGAAGKIPVFGILTRGGKAHVEVVPNVKSTTLMGITVKKVRRGSIIYTDKYQAYDSLMCCGYKHLSVDHSSRFCHGKVHINGLEGFWSWAKERLFKHHGISPRWFPLYLKEVEFRYNHREESLFDVLVGYMSDLIPEIPQSEEDSVISKSDEELKNQTVLLAS